MIIVEGPDGAGKTTLITALQAGLGLPIAPRVVAADTTHSIDLVGWVENNLDEGFTETLFDRHRLISEFIYGPILRDKMAPGFMDFDWVSLALARFYDIRPLIIYAIPPFNRVWDNVQGPENAAVAHRIPSIYTAYLARASVDEALAGNSVYVYDYTQHDVFDVIDWVATYLQEKRMNLHGQG